MNIMGKTQTLAQHCIFSSIIFFYFSVIEQIHMYILAYVCQNDMTSTVQNLSVCFLTGHVMYLQVDPLNRQRRLHWLLWKAQTRTCRSCQLKQSRGRFTNRPNWIMNCLQRIIFTTFTKERKLSIKTDTKLLENHSISHPTLKRI